MVGTNALAKTFEALDRHDSHMRTFRRLYCESGQTARKAYMFVNSSTKTRIEKIMKKCESCKYTKLQPRTIVLVYEALAAKGEIEVLAELCRQISSKKAYRLCNKRTQRTIQTLSQDVKGKSHKTPKKQKRE